MKIIPKPSPNFNDRRNGGTPEMLILHYTGMKSLEDVLEKLCDSKQELSCHYLVDKQGNIYQLVDEDKRAWHAGVSGWRGKDDINSRSIGIEIHNNGLDPYTPEQIDAVMLLCKDIMRRRNIAPDNVLGHSDVAPGRKQDPGTLFPWKKLANEGIGRWPKPKLRDAFNAAATARSEKRMKKLLARAGYPVDAFGKDNPACKALVTAFQQHYQPEAKNPGTPDKTTVKKLRALCRLNKKKT